jgi:hypothetical protein
MENIKFNTSKNIRHKGLALVEMAIVITLLLMVTLGIVGWGLLFIRAQEITNAARQGARLGCVYNANLTNVQTIIDNYLTTMKVPHDATSVVLISDPPNSVKATVKGKNLDVMGLRNIPFMGAFPNSFTATVIMAKEVP